MALVSLIIFIGVTISGYIIYSVLTCVVIEQTTYLITALNRLSIQIYHGRRINLLISNETATIMLSMLLDASNLPLVIELAILEV